MDNEMKMSFRSKSENERLARIAAAAFAAELEPTMEEISEIKTAVSEAVTNAIVHGYKDTDGEIVLTGHTYSRIIEFIIEDFGAGIDDVELARQPLYTGAPELERSGMGFTIMEAFMDKVDVESERGKGTRVVMIKAVGKR